MATISVPQYPEIKNTNEKNTYRNENGIVTTAGSLNFNNSTGQESISLASQSGDDLTFSNKVASFFHPNNKMEKVNGKKFSTVEGDNSMFVGKSMEQRVVGDLTIITGVPDFFTEKNKTATDYVELRSKIAAAGVQPSTQTGGYTNNSKGEIKQSGTPDPESGATDKQAFAPNPGAEGYAEYVEAQASKAIELEKKMGVGGSIKIISGKHLLLVAGTKASSFDSGYINPIGRKINKGSEYVPPEDGAKTGSVKLKTGAVPTYREKDTFSNMPFGSIDIIGNNKIAFKAGAGGIDFQGGGSMKMVGTGLTLIGGEQVSITANGCTTIDSTHTEVTGATLNVTCDENTIEGNVTIKGDTKIIGNLTVHGEIRSTGNITCESAIHANGNITSDADVIASGISLVNHVHGGVDSGGSKTAPPAS